MSITGGAAAGSGALELPPFSVDVQALDLGGDVKAVGLELVETENREPVRGKEGAEMWSAMFPAVAGGDPYVVDFFSHVERVREFCKLRGIAFRNAAERCVVLPQLDQEQLRQIFERFETETFGFRGALPRNRQMRRWKASCRDAGWTLTNRPTPGTLFARSARWRTPGSLS